jgi:DNA invertase Pin-like site-specific DNA recombinase
LKTARKVEKPTVDQAERPPRVFGYARVSTEDQNLALQRDALAKAGCDEVFEDKVSGRTTVRDGLDRLLARLRSGDTLTVWKLDRLGRGVLHLVSLLEDFRARGIEFRSLTEGMDTRTPMGRAMFHLAAVFAQLERDQTHERILAGIAAAKAAGTHCGRGRSLTPDHVEDARRKIAEGWSGMRVARFHGIARSTLYEALRRDDLARAIAESGLVPPKRGRGRPRKVDALVMA